MMTLNQLRGGVYKEKGLVGIEIETESLRPYDYPNLKYWTCHEDRSLRNYGVEYVLSHPLNPDGKAYIEAMTEFEALAKTTKFIDSQYAGLHVHINMSNVSLVHLMNFISLYCIFEKTLTKYCGPDRDGNLFCLKTSDAETSFYNYVALTEAIEDGTGNSFIQRLSADRLKYSGLNIVPLRHLGSVEVRTHYGTTDRAVIERWVRILMAIYNQAGALKSPVEVVNLFRDNYASIIAKRIFGDDAKHLPLENIEAEVAECLYYAVGVANASKDWSKFGSKKPEGRYNKFNKQDLDLRQLTEIYHNQVALFRDAGLGPDMVRRYDTGADFIINEDT
jgi:hypothetical protein